MHSARAERAVVNFLTEMTKPLADDPDFDGWVKGRTPAQPGDFQKS